MQADQHYEIIGPDGVAVGYFLDGRLYEYLTSTCVGYLNGSGQVVDGETLLGILKSDVYTQVDGAVYKLRLKEKSVLTNSD